MEQVVIKLEDAIDKVNNVKTQELRAIESFFFSEAEQVYVQIRDVLAGRLSMDIKEFFLRKSPGRAERLRAQDVRRFMRAIYVELMMGNLIGRLHTIKQAGEEKEFANIRGSFEIPFEDAVKFMRSLVPMRRDEFDRLSQELKFRAFTIARVFSLDVINSIKERYVKAIERGERIPDMMQFLDESLKKIGIDPSNPFWLETHARNNFLTAYNAGRWAQIAQTKTVRYLVYNAVLDERTTKLCRSLDGVVRPKDDPFWDRFMPPNHHACRSLATVVKNEFAYMKRIRSTSRKKIEDFERLVDEDKQLKREYQFRTSPARSLTGIPHGVYRRARDYGILQEIVEFNLKTKEREKWLREIRETPYPEKRAKRKFTDHEEHFRTYWGQEVSEDKYKELVALTLKEPDMIYAKFHEAGGGWKFAFTLFKKFGKGRWFLVGKTGNVVKSAYPVPENKLQDILKGIEREGAVRWK